MGRRELALADIERVLKLKPRHRDALYLRGLLFDKPTDEALLHLRIAADLGNSHAMNDLGYLYTSGKYGVVPNVEEGIAWWKKSAYFGDSSAASHLGEIYAEGRGVPVDHTEAVKYFRIAASGGDAKAMNELGLLLWSGKGAPASHAEAIDLWVKGAEKGLGQPWHNLRSLLSPTELAMVLVRHPYLVLHEGTRLWYPVAFIALLLLVTALIIMRLHRGATRA